MNNIFRKNIKIKIVFLFLSLLVTKQSFAQIAGSQFMLPNNFYAQMYNPAYMRNDKAIEVSIAGLGGFTFMNQGSFKISDLITTPSGKPVIDPVNFYNAIPDNNYFRQNLSVPMAFVSVPLKKGVFSFYYKENVSSVLKFKKDVIEYLVNGNINPEYESFNTDVLQMVSSGYREFALGYAKKANKKLGFGVHAKLLFGAAFFNAEDWNFGIETAPDGSIINLTSGGNGNLMIPMQVRLRSDSTILSFEGEKVFSEYMTLYNNPGFAFDLGVTYQIDKTSKISASVRDLGLIFYKDKSMTLEATGKYDYIGFDLINAIRWPEEPGYVDPVGLIDNVKDSLRNIWQPKVVEDNFAFGLGPKIMLHYQYDYSDFISFGVTNQSIIQKRSFQNSLTLSVLQKWEYLSVFESINLHGVNDVSIGAGLQYEVQFAQFFLATDNIIAFYHPANNKTFSINAGICLLFNNRREKEMKKQNSGIRKRKGKYSKHLPFHKQMPAYKK